MSLGVVMSLHIISSVTVSRITKGGILLEEGMGEKWDFYKDYADEWRWRRKDADGKLIAASPRGFLEKRECLAHAIEYGYVP